MSQTTHQNTPIADRVIETKLFPWRDFQFIQDPTFKEISADAFSKLKKSVVENRFVQPFYAWYDKKKKFTYCLDGKHRTMIMEALVKDGVAVPDQLPTTYIDCKNLKEAAKLVLIYSSVYAKINSESLIDFLQAFELDFKEMSESMNLPEVDMLEAESMFNGTESEQTDVIKASLQERFIVPPFSLLDTRQGYWQDRKRLWHKIMNSQETREDVQLIAKSGQSTAVYELRNEMRAKLQRDPEWDEILAEAKKRKMHVYEGASVFDPVLCEVAYRWFCPTGGAILDSFAGGSVRGVVAAMSGYQYHGVDLRAEQVEANQRQAEELNLNGAHWYTGDSQNIKSLVPDLTYDFMFSCPPYHDLEKYSDDPADLSNMSYEDFVLVYTRIINQSLELLNENSFACFVVGEIRSKNGDYKNFVGDTITAFQDAGAHYYNELILVNVAGSLAIRAGGSFAKSRKIGKMHQNVLVFWKGDPAKVKDHIHEIKIEELISEEPLA